MLTHQLDDPSCHNVTQKCSSSLSLQTLGTGTFLQDFSAPKHTLLDVLSIQGPGHLDRGHFEQ